MRALDVEPTWSRYIDPGRDCYEAYVLYCFLLLLEAYAKRVGGDDWISLFEGKRAHHPFPVNRCFGESAAIDRTFFVAVERAVLQYMVLKPALAAVQLVLTACDAYDGGLFDFTRGYAWIVWITNASQTAALCGLVYLYHAVTERKELLERGLLGKFLCIKAVVFFAFWQALAFSLLVRVGVITDAGGVSADDRSAAIDDFVLCVEMVAIAIAHHRVFSYLEYRAVAAPAAHSLKARRVDEDAVLAPYREMSDEALEAAAAEEAEARREKTSKRVALLDSVDVSDVASDIRRHLLSSRRAASMEVTTTKTDSDGDDCETADAGE